MSQIQFDANNVAPDQGLSPVPRGRYKVVMTESEIVPTKRGDGEVLKIVQDIIEGPFAGKKVPANLNWKNPSATAQQIGHAQLSAICHATGVMAPQATEQLHNLPYGIEVDVTSDGKYNDVRAFITADKVDTLPPMAEKVSGPVAATGPVGMAPAPAPAPAQPAPGAPPQPFTPGAAPTAQPVTAPPHQPAPAPAPVQPQPAPSVTPANTTDQPTANAATTSPSEAPVQQVEQPAQPTAETPPWIKAQQEAQAAAQGQQG